MPSNNNADELETLLLFLHLKIRGTRTQKPIYSVNVYHAWKIVLSSLRVATMFYKKSSQFENFYREIILASVIELPHK